MPYPDHWEADVVLTDGGTAHIRPIRADDAGLLREFYARLSPESIYYRFFSPRPRLTDGEVEHFTNVDYDHRVALIATIGTAMVAVVRYDRIHSADEAENGRSGTAEVAFLVEDAHQGRGLASVLLEHIAAAARERGIARFIADVLPENRRMSKVFREAGYKAEQRFEDGVLMLTLDLEPTETSREVMAAREHRAESRSIGRLLSPRSVAVIGASRTAHTVGQTVLRNLLTGGFAGPVFPVHPTATAVASVRAYPAIGDVPGDVDLAVVAVPADGVNDVVAQCAAKGVRGLVVLSSGFGEAGAEGRERQDELVRLARAGGMRVVGPNCLGIANNATGLNATLAPTLPRRGSVGFFSQSGALGIAILRWAAERDLGLSTFVSAGNRADVSGNDLMQYWEEDPDTSVVLLYLESIGNPRKFTRLARRISRSKPIVAVKSGRTTQGVPLGHAAQALSLPDHAVSALFAQAGVVRVDSLGELFDVAQILAYQPPPKGDRVAIVGNSDSIGLLVQDAATVEGLDPLPPVDLGPGAGPEEFGAALERTLADDAADAVIVVFAPAVTESMTSGVAAAIAGKAEGASKPVVATYLGERGLLHGTVPSYPAPEDAVRALAYAVRYAGWRRRPRGRVPDLPGVDRPRARALVEEMLGQGEPTAEQTAALLACYGIVLVEQGYGIATKITTSEDPSFGAIVSFGLDDVTAELLDDRAYRLAPLTDVEAGEIVRAVRTAPLLLGHHGAEPVDTGALEDLVLRASRLADDLPEVARLDLEPVLAAPDGAVVRGARLRLAGPPGRHAEEARRLRPS
ncbi:bifunctional GNAT family N-acetyltransferase/acetate--CoA ligase family protein [Actinoallomurus bryophytorum]|uniref:Acyl-CoA synthetase (NDP forming) n=1 Tax=Actinoallomurus bryophytorum TaxID=1490222 RepID=A0A543CRI2_9ACTN|nr:GNAT family N-acetyltransferase [Actinoallomurus bryophytorum]TQL99725.1 acyl-CoA synthetase (NDP forming) [Actinoallomurus bryophytorum]